MAAVAPTPPITRDLYTDYFKTPEGQMRTAEGVLAFAALISTAEGHCYGDSGSFGFLLLIIITTFLEAIVIVIICVLRIDEKLKGIINIPLSLVLNDGIKLILYFIVTTLSLVSIGRCDYRVAARIIGSLFIFAIFLVLIGLLYTDYLSWQKSISKEHSKEIGTTITESSPTVLT